VTKTVTIPRSASMDHSLRTVAPKKPKQNIV